jgi:hypothetical protein
MKYKQLKSNAYHPESQGALERFHQTLKNMMKTFCLDSHKDWDNRVRMLQLAVRESFQESLYFTSFELVFEHSMGGFEKQICENTGISILDYVECFNYQRTRACDIEQDNL